MEKARDYYGLGAVAAYALIALALRGAAFPNPLVSPLDEFYLLVGQRLNEGLRLYSDIWDRKPPGGFLLYRAIAAVSVGPVFYKLVAATFAVATALAIRLIGRSHCGEQGAFLAGALYLVLLGSVYGGAGELAVFYNFFVAVGALLVLRGRYPLAMLSLGVALTFKQTVAFEAVALGLLAIHRKGLGAAPLLVSLGALPLLLVSLPYAGSEYWHALVLSNLDRASPEHATMIGRSLDLVRRLIPLLTIAALGAVYSRERAFFIAWTAAAIAAAVSSSALYVHYAIPLLVPLCSLGAAAFDKRAGPILAIAAGAYSFLFQNPFNLSAHAAANREFDVAVAAIDRQPGKDLLVFDGPSALYTITDRRTLTPLVFPTHLSQASEADVSHLRTTNEMRRIVAARPSVVAMPSAPRNEPINRETRTILLGYLKTCARVGTVALHEMGPFSLAIYRCPGPLQN